MMPTNATKLTTITDARIMARSAIDFNSLTEICRSL
jgi:hypothetical protein